MDKRLFVLGLGTGLIAATLVIGAGNFLLQETPDAEPKQEAKQEPEQEQQQPAAQSDWQQAAQEAGMVILKKEDYQQQLDAAKADGAQQKEAELNNLVAEQVFVYIQPGMGTTDVARLMQAAGVLEDGNRLIALRANWPNPIRSGTYQLKKNSDPQDVLKAIATPPSE